MDYVAILEDGLHFVFICMYIYIYTGLYPLSLVSHYGMDDYSIYNLLTMAHTHTHTDICKYLYLHYTYMTHSFVSPLYPRSVPIVIPV